MLRKKLSMTIPEFCQLQRGNICIEDIEFNRQMERVATKIISNETKRKLAVFLLACGLMTIACISVYAATDPLKNIDVAGDTILTIVRRFARYICIIMCSVGCIKVASEGDTKSISKICLKFIMIYGSLYIIPWFYDLIEKTFG